MTSVSCGHRRLASPTLCDPTRQLCEERPMDRYPPIADHGLIGDLQTAALVTTDGPSTGSAARGSTRRASSRRCWTTSGAGTSDRPEATSYVTRQLYLPDTAILITRFMTPDGVGEVLDFMPVDEPQRATDRHRLVRVVRVRAREMRFVLDASRGSTTAAQSHDAGDHRATARSSARRRLAAHPASRRPGSLETPTATTFAATVDPEGRAGRRGGAGVGARRTTARRSPRGAAGHVQRDRAILARLARPLDLPRPLAGEVSARR